MHVLSKVLLGVVVVAAIIAVILTSKLRLARGHWLEQISQREGQLDQVSEDLRKKELAVNAARAEVNRLATEWGSTWPGVQGNVDNAQLGTVTLNIGGNQGLVPRNAGGEEVLPSFYAFATSPQGDGSKYLGEFRATGIQPAGTAAQMTRNPYEGEVQNWPPGPWRIRESIPSNWRSTYSGLQSLTADALQGVEDQQARLVNADKLIAESQEQLQRRLGQLEGNPDAPPDASPEVTEGLVATLRNAETQRNDDVGHVDDLRHEYDRKYRQLQTLIARNRDLESMLPQPGSAASTDPAGQQAIETSTQPSAR